MADSEILTAAQNAGLDEAQAQRLVAYLEWYGHFDTPEAAPLAGMMGVEAAETKLLSAVASLQSYTAMEPKGEITPQLMRILELPRCGVADVLPLSLTALEAKWRKPALTYHVAEFVNSISQKDQTDLIELAWDDWEASGDVHLVGLASRTTPEGLPVDIMILTGRGRAHGFDGSSGTLAWAYLPGGDDRQLIMRFDLDERWLKEGSAGILYRNVACHEFGHLLGLDHSRVNTALMAPYYSAGVVSPQQNDDVTRIESMYGKPKTPPTKPGGEWKVIITGKGPKPEVKVE